MNRSLIFNVKMAKVELKTKLNDASVEGFLNSIEDEEKRAGCFRVLELMKNASGEEPKMWGPSIIGFGTTHLKYESGRELDWMLVGFSPRKANITLYIMDCFERYGDLMSKLGKYKTGRSCLYIKRVDDIDMNVLEELVLSSIENLRSGRVFSKHE
jgi:hypothetical protein